MLFRSLTTFPLFSLYHATKFALIGFSESLGFELAPLGIRVKVVAPGGVATDFASRSMVRTFEGDGGAYADTIAKVSQGFAANRANYASSESLGQALFGAATDASAQTRYVVGADAEAILATRSTISDAQYVAAVQQRFGIAALQSSKPSS